MTGVVRQEWLNRNSFRVAELFALNSSDPVLRYTILFLTFLFLYFAIALFSATSTFMCLAVIALCYSIVGFTVFFWITEENRKRKIQLRDIEPQASDAAVPDMRYTALFVCSQLFIITALCLQVLNSTYLHFTVQKDFFGLVQFACGSSSAAGDCVLSPTVAEFFQWLAYTLLGLIKFAPVGDEIHYSAISWAGIQPTNATPAMVDGVLKFLFGTFFLTYVVGLARKIEGRVGEAIEMLKVSPDYAAAMGPIMLGPLEDVVQASNDGFIRNNAILAVATIARNYPFETTREEVQNKFESTLRTEFHQIPSRNIQDKIGEDLCVRATFLCSLAFEGGLDSVYQRIVSANDWVVIKGKLVTVAATSLPDKHKAPFFERLANAGLTGRVKSVVDHWRREFHIDDADD